MRFSRVSIFGPGLLGGSLALALRARFPAVPVAVWARRPDAVAEIRARGLADVATTSVAEAARDAGLIVLCVPIGAMAGLAEQIKPHLMPGAVVTDVGSVKGAVVEALAPIFGERFVGSHPMAGSEQVGLAAARADLFEGAVCILTPIVDAPNGPVAAVEEFWNAVGCRSARLSPRQHDETVAFISHLPHLVAATLVNLVCAQRPDAFHFCGTGFRDTTRVASGPPGMWAEILDGNRGAMVRAVEALITMLREVEQQLHDPAAVRDFLARAKEQRDRLRTAG